MKTLIHLWRLLTEPTGHGRMGVFQPKRWVVHYFDGNVTMPMAYDIACDYAEMWGGEVKRFRNKIDNPDMEVYKRGR